MTLRIDEVSPADWIEAIPVRYHATINEMMAANGDDEQKVAELWLSRVGPDNNVGFGSGERSENFVQLVKAELRKLLCGDPAYQKERDQASSVWQNGRTIVVSTIASSIAIKIGIVVAVLVPVVGLLLASASKVSLAAWCAMPD